MKTKQYDTVAELITKTYRRLYPVFKNQKLSEKAVWGMGMSQLNDQFGKDKMLPVFIMREVMNNLKSGRFFDKPSFYSFYVMNNYIEEGQLPWGAPAPEGITKGVRFTRNKQGEWKQEIL